MAFVRRKGRYFSLVESYREGGKVRQRVLAYLGTHATVEEAYQHWQREANRRDRTLRNLPDEEWAYRGRYYRSMDGYKAHAKSMVELLTPYRDKQLVEQEQQLREAHEAELKVKREATRQARQKEPKNECSSERFQRLMFPTIVPIEHYATLGIEPGATEEQIKRAYWEKAKTHHPARGGDAGMFRQIKEAYEALTQPNRYLFSTV